MLYEWDWAAAEAGFKRAIAADPNYPTARQWYGDYLAGRGRLEESLKEMRRGVELDPLSRIIGGELAWTYYVMHRNDEAQAQIDTMLRLDPNFSHTYFVQSLIYLQQRDYEKALTAHPNVTRSWADPTLRPKVAESGSMPGRGDTAAARRVLAALEARSKREYVPPWVFAVAYTGLGDKTRAIGWLNRGIDERDMMMAENLFDPILDPLRGDPRFAEVERRTGTQALAPPFHPESLTGQSAGRKLALHPRATSVRVHNWGSLPVVTRPTRFRTHRMIGNPSIGTALEQPRAPPRRTAAG